MPMTNKLSHKAFDRACKFVQTKARPLDRERLSHFLLGNNAKSVLVALGNFQNDNGGFGHGIEPDFRTSYSTAMATSVGLQVLRALRVGSDDQMARGAIRYLLATVDRKNWVWPIINKSVEAAPHAPWWDHSENLADSWNQFRFNPTAELIGYCFEHAKLVPESTLVHLESILIKNLEAAEILTSFYDLRCCLLLHDSYSLPSQLRDVLSRILVKSALKLDPEDPHVNYLDLVPTPAALLQSVLKKVFDAHVDKLMRTQSVDGCWEPWWEWKEVSEPEWQKAALEWKGMITRHTIEVLSAHDLVES
jgi:hypothetical protein